jgi:hypothetical protein
VQMLAKEPAARHHRDTTDQHRVRRQTAPIDQPAPLDPARFGPAGPARARFVSGALDEQLE